MTIDKKLNPTVGVVLENSNPPLKDSQEPKKSPGGDGVDIDDAQIEEPKDDAFKKSPQKQQPPKQKRKGA